MWLKADAASTLSLSDASINSWTYANDPSKKFTSSDSRRPQLVADIYNFKPAVLFSGAQEMNGPINALAPLAAEDDDYSVFLVWQGLTKAGFRIWEQWGCVAAVHSGASFAFQTGSGLPNYGAQFDIKDTRAPGFGKTGNQPYNFFEPLISQVNLYDRKVNDLEIVDNKHYNASNFTTIDRDYRFLANKGNVLGRRCAITDEPFSGYLAELIVFDRPITGVEREKIFSYLSFKYGILLHTSGALPSYYASDWNGLAGTIIWSGPANAPFTFDLFGIGRDDNAGLYQTIANSMNSGSGNGVGQSGKGNIILSNPAHLNDRDFLTIAHNGAVLAEQSTDMPGFATSDARRLSREWKVQVSGNPGPVQLSFDLTGITTTGTIAQTVMIVDEDGDGNFTTGNTHIVSPSSRDGNRVIFENVTFSNNQVFTFITKVDFVPLPLQKLQLKAIQEREYTVLQWVSAQPEVVTGYELEVSKDGRTYTKLMDVPFTNTATLHSIRLRHNPENGCFYRVKESYQNHPARYSNTVCVSAESKLPKAIAFPNPFQDNLNLTLTASNQGIAAIKVLNSLGAVINIIKRPVSKGINQIPLTPYIPTAQGFYTLSITLADDIQIIKVFKK